MRLNKRATTVSLNLPETLELRAHIAPATGLRRRLHDLRRPAPPLVLDAARAKLCAVISTLRDENGSLRNAFRP